MSASSISDTTKHPRVYLVTCTGYFREEWPIVACSEEEAIDLAACCESSETVEHEVFSVEAELIDLDDSLPVAENGG